MPLFVSCLLSSFKIFAGYKRTGYHSINHHLKEYTTAAIKAANDLLAKTVHTLFVDGL
jgi:hypothetical protein